MKEAVRGEGARQSGCGKQTRDGMAGDVSHISGSGEGRSSTHEKEKGKSGDGGVGARKRMPRASSRTCGVKVPCVRDLGRVIKVYHTVKPCIHLSHLVSCVVQQLPPQQQTRYSTTTASCSSYRLNNKQDTLLLPPQQQTRYSTTTASQLPPQPGLQAALQDIEAHVVA